MQTALNENQPASSLDADAQAAFLKVGMRVELLNNRPDDDAVVRYAWPPGDSHSDPVVIDGLDMR